MNDKNLIRKYLQSTTALHRHLCPRQVLGVRMGLLAARFFELELPQKDKRLLAFVETDGCFSDGVMVATGCSMGHRTMRLVDEGKVAVTFLDTKAERAMRVAPAAGARAAAAACMPDAPNRWKAQLEGYQVLPDEELLIWNEVEMKLDWKQIVGRPGVRVNCARCGEEILNQREVSGPEGALCRQCAGERYWSAQE